MGMWKLTIYCITLELYGKSPKPHPSFFWSHTWALHRIWKTEPSLFQSKRNRSILGQFKNGKQDNHTPSLKSSKYMENCYMQHWLSQQDMLISPTWRPCSESSIIVLSYPTPHPAMFQVILDGGRNFYNNYPSCDKYPNQPKSSTTRPFLTPTQDLVLQLQLETNGEHGGSFQDGNQMEEISVGQKISGLNSWYATSSDIQMQAPISKSTGTTMELLKDGGKDVAKTNQQTSFSGEFTNYQANLIQYFTLTHKHHSVLS